MHISENGLRLIERFEGFVGRPYWDPYGRVWTRGYGETEGIGPNSPVISQHEAEGRLRMLVEARYEPALRGLPLNQNEWDALCSFIWNVGPGTVGQGTTLRALLEQRRIHEVGAVMEQYVHAGGQVLAGLVTRRREEVALLEATPPDPYAGLTAHERELVAEYDQLEHHPHVHGHALAKIRAQLVKLRKEVWTAAVRGFGPGSRPVHKGWDVENRAHRYHVLLARTR